VSTPLDVSGADAIPIWLGDSLQVDFDEKYISRQSELSNAAYCGDWDSLFQILDTIETDYSEP
jgi:hypothetical protein